MNDPTPINPPSGVKTDPSLAVLTRSDSGFGIGFLRELERRGLRPAVLGLEDTPFGKRWRMFRRLSGRIGLIDASRYQRRFWTPVLRRAVSRGRWSALPEFEGLADRVVRAANINDQRIVSALREAGVTKIILAQSGIVRHGILGTPNAWVVNAHPAVLPMYRGVDVVRWTLRDGGPLGATMHVVDRGVDTGGVIARRPINVLATDHWRQVEARCAAEACMDLLLDAATNGPAGYAAPEPQPKDAGRQYYLMPFRTAKDLDQRWPKIRAKYVRDSVGQFIEAKEPRHAQGSSPARKAPNTK